MFSQENLLHSEGRRLGRALFASLALLLLGIFPVNQLLAAPQVSETEATGPAVHSSNREEEYRHAPVGEPRWIRQLVLPGPELIAAPGDFRSPIVIRIDSVSPHGTDLRYDLTWYGLDPGVYDLRDFLQRVDGSSLEDLPTLLVEVLSVLPAGLAKPHALAIKKVPLRATYKPLLWAAAIAWLIGFVLLLRMGRKHKQAAAVQERPRTLAEVMRPLVERALEGQLSDKERAELELTLIAHWRRKLDWEGIGTAEAMSRLRVHPEAGVLLVKLEEWLHRPTPPTDIDLDALLAPYRQVTAGGRQ